MVGDGLPGVFRQVVPQVPAIGDLGRVRGAVAGVFGIGAGPVPADDRRAGMRRQPRRRPPPANTRRGPAKTPARTAGRTPTPPGTTRRSPPRPQCPPPCPRTAPPGAGTTGPAAPHLARRLPRREQRHWPAQQPAWQTAQATRLPGATILADHCVLPEPVAVSRQRAAPIPYHDIPRVRRNQPQHPHHQLTRAGLARISLTVITKFAAEPFSMSLDIRRLQRVAER